MAPTPGSAVFIDTNVLVYASFPNTPFYEIAHSRLSELESRDVVFWISRQVLRELLHALPGPEQWCPSLQPLLSFKQSAGLKPNLKLRTIMLP